MNNNKRKWQLQHALEYANDRSLRSRQKPSRIFIEPPDESTSTYEESDDETGQTKLNVDCEVILRSGKRLKSDRSKPINSVDDRRKQCNKRKLLKDGRTNDVKRSKVDNNSICDSKAEKENCSVNSTGLPIKGKRKQNIQNENRTNDNKENKGDTNLICDSEPKKKNCSLNSTNEPIKGSRKQCHKQKNVKKVCTNDNTNNNVDTNSICDIEPEIENETEKNISNKKVTTDFVWIDDVSMPMEAIFPAPNYTDCSGLSAYEQFEKFVDSELLRLIVDESSNYAIHLGKPDPKVTVAELKVYIAILIISGYSVQSRFESYWSNDPDLRNDLICSSMRKNRFKQITQFLHFADLNKPNSSDKIWKLRPLTDHLKTKILLNFHPEQNLSYDESMIEYFGRHGMKQYLKDKPVPFGYKVWSLCTPSGYLANFEIYQGKNPRSKTLYEEQYGKCIAPLFNMIDDFEEHIRELPFSFYFDNLFTGIPALLQLKTLGYNGTGTIRENRLPSGCPLKQTKKTKQATKKKGRGFMDGKSIDGFNIHVTKWVDNSVVSVASTVYGMKPITKALRYSSVDQKKVEVPRPLVVAKYNQHMGGVDRMDQNISLYRIGIHGKKWWSCIFTWMIDVAIQNAWQLHRVDHPEMPQLDFRREITLFYCGHYGVPPKSTGNRQSKNAEKDSKSIRYDKLSHWPRCIPNRRRCAEETCKGTPKTICAKCDVGLCIKCFESYHSIEKFRK